LFNSRDSDVQVGTIPETRPGMALHPRFNDSTFQRFNPDFALEPKISLKAVTEFFSSNATQ
jgi:hypothetical protein